MWYVERLEVAGERDVVWATPRFFSHLPLTTALEVFFIRLAVLADKSDEPKFIHADIFSFSAFFL
jgi:hypothetical protein